MSETKIKCYIIAGPNGAGKTSFGEKSMKKASNSQLALNAMHRASKKAVEKAARLDLSIPVWKDGKIIFIKAKEKLQKLSITS